MNTSLDCFPCFLRQTLDAARMASKSPADHERILREVLRWMAAADLEQSPPALAKRIHQCLRELSGLEDPYREVKTAQNAAAISLRETYREEIAASADPLLRALKLAAAANSIDLGAKTGAADPDVMQVFAQTAHQPVRGDVEPFRAALAGARRILYLADNAGEIVFDRLLIERFPPSAHVTVAVRGAPVINDATLADAHAAGIEEVAEILENGSDAPGTLLQDCTEEFRRRFQEADLILSKDQGNYETLSDAPREIFFLFRVKCPVTMALTRQPIGTHVLLRSGSGSPSSAGEADAQV